MFDLSGDDATSYFRPLCIDFSLCRPSKIARLSPCRLTGEGAVAQLSHYHKFGQCFSHSGKNIGSTCDLRDLRQQSVLACQVSLILIWFTFVFFCFPSLPQVYDGIARYQIIVVFLSIFVTTGICARRAYLIKQRTKLFLTATISCYKCRSSLSLWEEKKQY